MLCPVFMRPPEPVNPGLFDGVPARKNAAAWPRNGPFAVCFMADRPLGTLGWVLAGKTGFFIFSFHFSHKLPVFLHSGRSSIGLLSNYICIYLIYAGGSLQCGFCSYQPAEGTSGEGCSHDQDASRDPRGMIPGAGEAEGKAVPTVVTPGNPPDQSGVPVIHTESR